MISLINRGYNFDAGRMILMSIGPCQRLIRKTIQPKYIHPVNLKFVTLNIIRRTVKPARCCFQTYLFSNTRDSIGKLIFHIEITGLLYSGIYFIQIGSIIQSSIFHYIRDRIAIPDIVQWIFVQYDQVS